jgi:ElaB/YqjD/DUF883 family membrane-anchored ribosome-binding protein
MDLRLSRQNRLARELRRLAGDMDALLQASGDKLGNARDAVNVRLRRLERSVDELETATLRGVRRTARRADRYAHSHPWRTAGGGMLLGVIAGVALGIALGPRRD